MRVRTNVALVSAVALSAALIPHAARSQSAAKVKAAPTSRVLTAEKVNKRQFDRQLKTLPDTAVVESGGQRITVGEIRAKAAETQRASAAEMEAGAKESGVRFAAREARFAQQRMARLEADNAKAKPELTRLQGIEAIRVEARQLMERSKTANAAEMAQLDQRAGELLQQLHVAVKSKPQ